MQPLSIFHYIDFYCPASIVQRYTLNEIWIYKNKLFREIQRYCDASKWRLGTTAVVPGLPLVLPP